MRTTTNALVAATRGCPLDRVDVGRHRDFDRAAIARIAREIDVSGAREGDALVIEEGAPVECMRLCDLLAWLRGHALDDLAVKVERTVVPPMHVVALIISEECARVRVMRLRPDDSTPPKCAVLQ